MTKLTFAIVALTFICACNGNKTENSKPTDDTTTKNSKNDSNTINICIDRLPREFPNPDGSKPAGGLNRKVWRNLPQNSKGQQIINVRFLEGTEFIKNKVIQYAKQWEPFANVEFRFFDIENDPNIDPEIKISFLEGDGSWSYIGSDSKYYSPSMNFGWFTQSTSEDEFSRVVLHEFGHALSLIHEHQNPKDNPIQWNKDAVYRYFSGRPNYWSKAEIDNNLLAKYAINQINGSSFDPNSIMLYSFPASLTLNGKGTNSNTTLSPEDKKVIKRIYNE